jgi:hypothetical protein
MKRNQTASKKAASLERINKHLAQIKKEINENWGPDLSGKNEVSLFIQDKKTNPWRKQVEDIEGDVNDMTMMSR